MSVSGSRVALAIKTRITTPDVDATRAFYERVLGLAVVETWEDPGDRGVILALSPSAREGLLEIHDGPAGALDRLSLQFKVHDLAAFTDALPSGVPYDGPTTRPWGSTYVYLRDPNGVQVVVYSGGW